MSVRNGIMFGVGIALANAAIKKGKQLWDERQKKLESKEDRKKIQEDSEDD